MKILSEWRQICRRVFSWQQAGVFLIMAVGMTLATVMFAIGHGYSSQSLPYKDAERLVSIGYVGEFSSSRFPLVLFNAKLFQEWKDRGDLFAGAAAFATHEAWRLNGANGNIRLRGYQATENFFDVLGVWFPEIEEWKRAAGTKNLQTVVFTHGVGMRDFGRDSIGRLFHTYDGGGVIAGGILPANFAFPHEMADETTEECGITAVPSEVIDSMYLSVIARLAPGITPQIVEQALNSLQHDEIVTRTFGKIVVMPLPDLMAKSYRPIVWGSWALGGMVLILCTANLAGVLLVRASGRLREYAIRTALGAMFTDLARLLLVELTAISVLAAWAAWFASRAVVSVVGGMVPVMYLSFGRPVFRWEETVFLIVGTVVVAILSALASLVVIARNYRRGFSQGQAAVFYSQRWMRMLLTTGQVAITMILLSLSYMTMRGYVDIFKRDAGMDTGTRLVTVSHSLAFGGESSRMSRKSIMDSTLVALRGGDSSAPVAVYRGTLFSAGISRVSFNRSSPVYSVLTPEEISGITFAYVSPGFFRTAKIRLLAGREFNDADREEVLINASFARRMGWSPAEAVGRLLNPNTTVIGVADDFPTASWRETIPMTFYRPLDSYFFSGGETTGEVIFNYIIDPAVLSRIGSVERAILSADPEAVIRRNASWSDLLGESVRGQRFAAISVILFTIAAIAIVVIGISNTVMFIIARRTKDIAIHIAVCGARARHVCWFVMSDMVKSGIIGILAGGLASWWVCKAAASFIFGVDQYWNTTGLVFASVAMLLVIALACLPPALRALRIDPFQALKME